MSTLLVDTEVANIGSWQRILSEHRVEYTTSSTLADIKNINKVIFPGVGNFGKVMSMIKEKSFDKKLIDLIVNKKITYLGICVGMQILFENSEEANVKGLGLIDGNVKKNSDKKIPKTHNGWNNIKIINQNSKIIKNIDQKKDFYFNHSYYCKLKNKEKLVACLEDSNEVCTIIEDENIFGTQFHPEKSHDTGVKLIKNFLEA